MRGMNDPRHSVILPALCWSRRRRDFYAITTDVSADGIRLRSSALLAPGENLTCSIRHIGLLKARIDWTSGQDFVVSIQAGRAALAELARQFVTLARAQDLRAEPLRIHRRIVPRQKIVTVTLADGRAQAGHVLNISASGVALLIDPAPEIGTTFRVGRTAARVIRHFTDGLGAAFAEPFEPSAVHEAMIL